MLILDDKEVELLYVYANKELRAEYSGGTWYTRYHVVCPCCGYHDANEEELENVDNGYKLLDDLITHYPTCEFEEYKAVLKKLADSIKIHRN